MPQDPIDRGLAEAFGHEEVRQPATSVLQRIQARANSKLGVHLESPGPDDAPIKVTEDVGKLRDPSHRYQLLGEIGRGGVGTVFKGRDQDLGRDVAMKVLKDEFANRPDVLARFVEEAQIGGQLQHPGIVPVYELGLQAGERPYFAMKLVKGETLAAQLARRGDPSKERRRLLGVFEQICQTMAYAHVRRVVHRDLKPANVMIGAFGEVQVVDWGFAKVLPTRGVEKGEDATVAGKERSVIETVRSASGSESGSIAGSMLGTPHYMPPEQAIGDIDRIDQRSDVFALGAILCEILTGEPPYREVDGDIVHQAVHSALDGARKRLLKSGADEALIDLCVECLAPVRRARPESAGEVTERVSAYLTSVEDRAQRAELAAAETRYRHKVTLLSASAALALIGFGATAWIWMKHDEQQRREKAMHLVAVASNEVSNSLGKAQVGLNLAVWDAALTDAQRLVTLAEEFGVDATTLEKTSELLARVQAGNDEAHAEVARRRRDDVMRERLRDLRVPTDEDVRDTRWFWREQQRLDAAYGEAFAAYLGKPLFEMPTESALRSMRHGDIEVELATSLDHWGLARDGMRAEGKEADPEGTARIRELSILLDSRHSQRSKLRALLPNAKTERKRLETLAESTDVAALAGAGCRVLSDALWRAGAEKMAVDVLVRAREIQPRDFDLCFQLAVAYELLDEPNWEEATATHRIANALRPGHDGVLHRQGMALTQLGRHADAERLWRILIDRDPRDSHWLRHLGQAQAAQHQRQQAVETYRRAMELGDTRANELFNLGTALRELGSLLDARRCFERAIELDPLYGEAHNSLGMVFSHQGKFEDAIRHFERAIALEPRVPAPYTNMAGVLRGQGKLEEALKWHRRSIAWASGDVKSSSVHHVSMGKTFQALRRWNEAEASFRKAMESDPGSVVPRCSLAYLFQLRGQLDKAEMLYKETAGVDPDSAAAYLGLGNLHRAQRRPEDAMKCFRRAVQIDPRSAAGLYSIAALQYSRAIKGEPAMLDNAFDFLSRALKVRPNYALAHDLMGCVWRMRSNPTKAVECHQKAIECHQKAIQYQPRNAVAHYNLGLAWIDLAKTENAIASFQKATKLRPDYAAAHFWLGYERKRSGQLQRAVQDFENTIRINSRHASAYNNLGLTLSELNQLDSAAECFRRGIRSVSREQAGPLHMNLGGVLAARRELPAAVEAFQAAEAGFALQDSAAARTWRKLAAMNAKSTALVDDLVVSPRRVAVSPSEWAAAVGPALEMKFYREIVALTQETLREKSDLTEGRGQGLYLAASAAALLAADSKAEPREGERSRLRTLARAWLAREVELWRKWASEDGTFATEARRRLVRARQDPNFRSVRGDALTSLPETEREDWQELWGRIEESGR